MRLTTTGFAALLAALLAAMSLIVVGSATSAQAAAAGCYHDTCTDKGPVSQNCDDTGTTIGLTPQISLPSGNWTKASLMWSSGCHSYWARGASVNTGEEGNGNGNYWVRITRRNITTKNVTYQNKAHVRSDDGGAWNWTNMAGGTTTSETRACGKPEFTGSWECTYWSRDSHSSCRTTTGAAPKAAQPGRPRTTTAVPC